MSITGNRRGPTMKLIAEEAGVSIALVSKVLHGRATSVRVSEETAQTVRETARRLNYVPNGLARSLRTNRSHTVGLIFENFGQISAGPLFYVYLFDGIAQELFSHHYRLSILPEVDPINPLASLADGRLDGVIWCKMPSSDDFMDRIRNCPVPMVALNAPPPSQTSEIVFVACDNEKGAGLVVEYLASLGHKRIVFALERNEEETPDALARLAGFRKACEVRNLPCGEDELVVWSGEAREFSTWWHHQPRHTAIFAWNEGMGAAILRQAIRAGVEVPRELSVIGFDSTQFCETTTPRLTAVRQPIREMAAHAAKTMVNLIEGHLPSTYDVLFPCSLDVRDSTAPPSREKRTQ